MVGIKRERKEGGGGRGGRFKGKSSRRCRSIRRGTSDANGKFGNTLLFRLSLFFPGCCDNFRRLSMSLIHLSFSSRLGVDAVDGVKLILDYRSSSGTNRWGAT